MSHPGFLPARLVVKDLACEKGGRLLFKGLSFSLQGGSALVISGPNGVGKTSLLRILAGLATPLSGQIQFDGPDPEKPMAEKMHFLGSRDGLKAALTPEEHGRYWRDFYGEPKLDSSANLLGDWLTHLHLTKQAHVPAGVLSSGQRRRLAFGRLLLDHRPVWLLDEPMNALDPAMRESFMTPAISAHMKAGGIVIASTHIPLGLQLGLVDMQHLSFAEDGSHSLEQNLS